jgi:endoglucanase Acf2
VSRHPLWVLFLASCATAAGAGPPAYPSLPRRTVGAGAILEGLPPGERGPSDRTGAAVRPKIAPGFIGAPPTNDWWSSLIWPSDPANAFSQPMFPHPLALQAEAGGLGISYPTTPLVDQRSFAFVYQRELRLGVEGLTAREAVVESASDWVVTALWSEGPRSLHATFGHGLPFVYARAHGGRPVVELAGAPRLWSEGGNVIGLTVNGHPYGLFLPAGARWLRSGEGFVAQAGGAEVPFSIAALPEESPAALALFRARAFAFVTGSRVEWKYDEARATLVTSFAVTTTQADALRPAAEPLLALYPHQWQHADLGRPLGHYTSPRGQMQLFSGPTFETHLPVTGVLPILPPSAGPDRGTLRREIKAAASGDLFPPGPEGTRGTYWSGKAMQKVALLAWLADQIGDTETRDDMVRALETELGGWLDGHGPRAFAYQPTWHTLIGVPQEYRSGWELNDHHFHAGYFVFAAATVARFDPGWATVARWGPMIDLLIKDVASTDRGDPRFPFLRSFDAYAGHSWANGPALFDRGNNEESSSEEMNFANGVLLWGALTGDRATRDLGVFLHTQVATAIEQYWFDVDKRNFPPHFDHRAVGILWGNGGAYQTWWDPNPVYVHAINFLPFTGGSLYLGRRPAYVADNQRALEAAAGGSVRLWRDLVWMHGALADPDRAATAFERDHYFDPERGNTWAFTYHWIYSLRALGQVDATVTADIPTYAIFRKGQTRTHAAFNPGPGPRQVTFSDGATLVVPAGQLRTVVGGGP